MSLSVQASALRSGFRFTQTHSRGPSRPTRRALVLSPGATQQRSGAAQTPAGPPRLGPQGGAPRLPEDLSPQMAQMCFTRAPGLADG